MRAFITGVREIVVERSWSDRVQDLVARRREAWPLLAFVGVAVVAALVVGGKPSSARIAPPAQPAPAVSPEVSSSPGGSTVLVHVAGAVREPGLYEFPAGARVADAVESAGGATRRADLDLLNLAEILVDGTKVEVLQVGDAPQTAPPAAVGGTAQQAPALIPLNTADQAALETIPGIGPVTATAILAHRQEIGRFESLEQLLDVDGIGPATFESIRAYLTL